MATETTVTIDRAYFETLLRRAEFHTTGRDLSTPINVPIVSIPKIDHENLLRIAQEYAHLKQALYDGGIEKEALETLIHGEQAPNTLQSDWADEQVTESASPKIFSRSTKSKVVVSRPKDNPQGQPSSKWPASNQRSSGGFQASKSKLPGRNPYGSADESNFTSDNLNEEPNWSGIRQDRPHYELREQRTIIAKNLSERATHMDVIDFVRGGTLLDIYLRTNDRSASISFVEGDAALNFMNHVKRNDVYVHGKRIEFAWSERQFILPKHVASKIAIGATRNIVIRNATADITEKRVREDLDHIHNIVIVDIAISRGDVTISLNSINNSLFARSCMMSRTAYKGLRIEWVQDECSQPLPNVPQHQKSEVTVTPAKRNTGPINRYQMLMNTEGTEDGSDDAADETTLTELSSLHVGRQPSWNTSTVAT